MVRFKKYNNSYYGRWLVVFIVLGLVYGCKGLRVSKPLVLHDTVILTHINDKHVFDTIILTDTMIINKLYECDSNYLIVAKDYNILKEQFDKLPKAMRTQVIKEVQTIDKVITKEKPIYREVEKIKYKTPAWLYIAIGMMGVMIIGLIVRR